MANVKITQLPVATAITSDDLLPIVESGSVVTQQANFQQVLSYITSSTFNSLEVSGIISGSSGTFSSLTSSVRLPDKTITINTASPISATDLSLSLSSSTSGLFRSYIQTSPSTFEEGLGIATNGRVIGYTYTNVSIPFTGGQTIGGLNLTTGDSYTTFHLGKPTTLAYGLAGLAMNLWSEGGFLGGAAIRDTAACTGDVGDPTVGPNYYNSSYLSYQFPHFTLTRARNNLTSPSVVESGDILGSIFFEGRTTTGTATQANVNDYKTGCYIAGIAEQQFNSTSNGSGIGLWTVSNGTTSTNQQAPAMWINNAGNVGIGLGASATSPFSPVQAQHKLEVSGTVLIRDDLTVEGGLVADVKVSGSVASPIQLSSYTLSSDDRGKTLLFSSSATQAITCSSGFSTGYNCTFVQMGSGQLVLTASSGVSILNRQSHTGSAGLYAAVSVVVIDSDTYLLAGDTL